MEENNFVIYETLEIQSPLVHTSIWIQVNIFELWDNLWNEEK